MPVLFKLQNNIWFFLVIFITISCTGTKNKRENILPPSENLLTKVNKIYLPYEKMSAHFDLSGKIGKDEVVYFGSIKAMVNKDDINKSYLLIKIKDTVFLADFYTLEIKNGYVYQTDHLTDKKIKTSLTDYKWVEIFGNVIPFHFYFPILLGLPPLQIFENEAIINEEEQKIMYRSDLYETLVEFSGGYIKKIYFRTKLKKDVLSLSFSGNIAADKRHFPESIWITKSKSKDYIKMRFSKLKVK